MSNISSWYHHLLSSPSFSTVSHIFPGQRLPWATDHMVQKWASCPRGRPLCRGPQHPRRVQLGHQRCAGRWCWQIHLWGCKWWWGSSSDRGTDSGRSEDSYSVVLVITVWVKEQGVLNSLVKITAVLTCLLIDARVRFIHCISQVKTLCKELHVYN